MEEEKLQRLRQSKFKQQELPAWRPITLPKHVVGVCVIVGVAFVAVGILIGSASSGAAKSDVVRYDTDPACHAALLQSACYLGQHDADGTPLALKEGVPLDPTCGLRAANSTASKCAVNISLSEDMQPPIYVYYQLGNFFQNHRRYVPSRLDKQLRGDDWDSEKGYRDDIESKCADAGDTCRRGHASHRTNKTDSSGAPLYWCNPCGLVARSFFNDRFELLRSDDSVVPWTQDGIAWESDVKHKYKNTSGTGNKFNLRLPEEDALVTDPDFIVWMRVAALPEFRKLYRIIHTPLKAGTYTMSITNNYDVSYFGGEKALFLTELTSIGSPTPELGYAYIAVGGCCVLAALVIVAKEKLKTA
jgi:hypothetical protein